MGEKGLEAHVAARAVKRDKALRSFIQKVQALEAKVRHAAPLVSI